MTVFKFRFSNFIVLLFLISAFSKNLFSQTEKCNCPSQGKVGKGTFYGAWGYNKDWFSKSDLHFKGNDFGGYNFTLEDVKAKDRPGFKNILTTTLAVPQYVYRFGYYFNNKKNTGIEINFDHAKYVMVRNQMLHLNGTIAGESFDKDTLVDEHFLLFEHTNGANFMMINFLKRYYLLVSQNKKHWLSFVGKAGAGVVIPKTDVTLFGTRLDNKFHVAGYIAGLDVGLRYDLFRYFFIEASAKGIFANYANVLTVGDGKAHHHFFTGEAIAAIGIQVNL